MVRVSFTTHTRTHASTYTLSRIPEHLLGPDTAIGPRNTTVRFLASGEPDLYRTGHRKWVRHSVLGAIGGECRQSVSYRIHTSSANFEGRKGIWQVKKRWKGNPGRENIMGKSTRHEITM